MNGAHIHLLLNHVPVLGTFFALLLLFYGLLVKSDSVKKAALLMMIVTTLIGIPAYLSGEDAEDILRPVSGVNKEAIEVHEEMAETAFWIMLLSGITALITILYTGKSKVISTPLIGLNLILITVVFIMMARTGYSGGEIRHNEIFFEKTQE